MEKRDKDRLRKNRVALLDIDPSKISDHLIQEDVFSPQMMEEILSQPTAKNQMGKLLNGLEKRGPHAYRKFRKLLCEDDVYHYLVEKLDRTPLPVDVDEVDAQPVRQEGSSTSPSGVVTGRGQVRNFTVNGNNNFAIFGGTNTKINM